MSVEYQGRWKISNLSDEFFEGILCIDDNNKIILHIPNKIISPKKMIDTVNIYGETNEGIKISLIDCICSGKFGMTTEITYFPNYIINGICCDCVEAIKINKVVTSFTCLKRWIPSKYHNSLDKIINYHTNEFDLNIVLNEEPKVEFLFKQMKTLEESRNTIKYFSQLLILFIGTLTNNNNTVYENINGESFSILPNRFKLNNEVDVQTFEMLIDYITLKDRFDGILNDWYEKKSKLESIVWGVVSALTENSFTVPTSFITVIQAAEAFSRKMRPNCKEDETKHNERIERILSTVTEEDKLWLKEKLEYSNEPSLPYRLKNLLKEGDFLVKLNSRNRKSLSRKIADTRNYYTHFDDEGHNLVMTPDEIIRVTNYITLLLRTLILQEIGITEDDILISFKHNLLSNEKWCIKYFKDTFNIIEN